MTNSAADILVSGTKFLQSGFRSYYDGHLVPLPNSQSFKCTISCLYLEHSLTVIIEPTMALHGAKLTRFRNNIVSHVVELLRVPVSKLNKVTYIERHTHTPNEKWVLVNLLNPCPSAISPVPLDLRKELQSSLLGDRDKG